jgi:hypothetical protein
MQPRWPSVTSPPDFESVPSRTRGGPTAGCRGRRRRSANSWRLPTPPVSHHRRHRAGTAPVGPGPGQNRSIARTFAALAALWLAMGVSSASASAVVNTIPVGSGPDCVSSDGTHVWVANYCDGTVREIQITASTPTPKVSVTDNTPGVSAGGDLIFTRPGLSAGHQSTGPAQMTGAGGASGNRFIAARRSVAPADFTARPSGLSEPGLSACGRISGRG